MVEEREVNQGKPLAIPNCINRKGDKDLDVLFKKVIKLNVEVLKNAEGYFGKENDFKTVLSYSRALEDIARDVVKISEKFNRQNQSLIERLNVWVSEHKPEKTEEELAIDKDVKLLIDFIK